ncbi:MAG TPA: phosphoribosylanthranilate isomerase [Thermoanaerobaculia bacterium]|nr:phosphoribosylanthranilate isomerase [Thermoanaerobaculia bacterium]
MSRLRVKVCGVTRPPDAEAAVELGVDLVGVNLWPGSPRAVSVAQARDIAAAVAGAATLVGVFVRQGAEVAAAMAAAALDLAQLHGDEGPPEVAALEGRAIKVFRVADAFDPRQLAPYQQAWGFLFDCRHPRLWGGSGEGWRFEAVRGLPAGKPILVAGGVRPGRVGEVLRRCAPWGIDVCSGVESAPGIKDHDLMRQLFEEVREHEQEHQPA